MVSNFQQPESKLPQIDARTLGELVSAAADLTVMVDGAGIISHLSHNLRDLPGSRISSWQGRPLGDVVRRSSRAVLKTMLLAARDGQPAKGFDVGHRLEGGEDLPIQYSAVRIGGEGQVILVGRDLRPLADLQSQLLANRQSLARNRKRHKQSEAHYRLLFETTSDAVLIVDAGSGRIREANPRAAALLNSRGSDLAGRRLAAAFDRSRQADVQALLARVAASGVPVTLTLEASGNRRRLSLSADLFRADDLKLVLLRVSAPDEPEAPDTAPGTGLDDLVRNAAEAVLLTGEDGRVLWANESFLALAGLPLAAQAAGRQLDEVLRWSGVEQDGLLAELRRHGRIPMFPATVARADGGGTPVEVSALARSDGSQPGYAFVMRARSEEEAAPRSGPSDLTRTAEGLIDLVGRVPMKDMVRDTTDVIERLCIEAALRLTGNNRASAARVLGLSRQALYLKMHRFGVADEEAPTSRG